MTHATSHLIAAQRAHIATLAQIMSEDTSPDSLLAAVPKIMRRLQYSGRIEKELRDIRCHAQ